MPIKTGYPNLLHGCDFPYFTNELLLSLRKLRPKLTTGMQDYELLNQMQIELRATVTLLDINVMQTLLGKVKYSTHPLSDEWRQPGRKKECELYKTQELQFRLVYSLTE